MNPNFPQGLDIAASRSPLQLSGDDIKVYNSESQGAAIARYGIAGRVWEASYLLAAYLEPSSIAAFDPPCSLLTTDSTRIVLELGSGSGYVARRIARACDKLVCTDLQEVCALLRDNMRDLRDTVEVAALPWGDIAAVRALESLTPTHIVCCDLIYFPELLAPLLRTLLALTATNAAAEITLACTPASFQVSRSLIGLTVKHADKIRSQTKEGPFWAAFGMWFAFERVAVALAETQEDVLLFTAHRKLHTCSWPVPTDDSALLEGVGLPSREGADAFELMLLMAMTAS